MNLWGRHRKKNVEELKEEISMVCELNRVRLPKLVINRAYCPRCSYCSVLVTL